MTDAAGSRSRIFISYRREDSEIWVGRLAEDLSKHFAREQIFQDVASIDPGADFRTVLDEALATAGAMLVVIGRQWLSATDKQGRKRLETPGDLVCLEVAESLRRPGVRVFPLLVDRAEMPAEDDLPESLKALARREALELTARHWTNDVARLVQTLKRAPGLTDDRTAEQNTARQRADQAAERREFEERVAKEEAQRKAAEEQAKKGAHEEARRRVEAKARDEKARRETTEEIRRRAHQAQGDKGQTENRLKKPVLLDEPKGERLFIGAVIGGTLALVLDWVLLPIVAGADWWSYGSQPHLRAGKQLMLNNAILAVATTAISSLVAYRGFPPAPQLSYVLPGAAVLGVLIAIFFQQVLDLASLGGWPAIVIHNVLFAYGSAVLWLVYQRTRRRKSSAID